MPGRSLFTRAFCCARPKGERFSSAWEDGASSLCRALPTAAVPAGLVLSSSCFWHEMVPHATEDCSVYLLPEILAGIASQCQSVIAGFVAAERGSGLEEGSEPEFYID